MTSNSFFIRQTDSNSPYVYLEGEEHYHLSCVARICPKEKVWLFDSHGQSYLAQVEEIEKERTRLLILEKKEAEEAKTKITLAQALIKAKKMEFLIQKSTELGVASFVPVITARSLIKTEEKATKKLGRWQRIAREAVKQSKNSWLPSISPPLSLERVIKEIKAEKRLFLNEDKGKYLREILIQHRKSQRAKSPQSAILLIGPEGGWTREEAELILANGFEEVSLGKNILRSETAALCSLALISHFWNL